MNKAPIAIGLGIAAFALSRKGEAARPGEVQLADSLLAYDPAYLIANPPEPTDYETSKAYVIGWAGALAAGAAWAMGSTALSHADTALQYSSAQALASNSADFAAAIVKIASLPIQILDAMGPVGAVIKGLFSQAVAVLKAIAGAAAKAETDATALAGDLEQLALNEQTASLIAGEEKPVMDALEAQNVIAQYGLAAINWDIAFSTPEGALFDFGGVQPASIDVFNHALDMAM